MMLKTLNQLILCRQTCNVRSLCSVVHPTTSVGLKRSIPLDERRSVLGQLYFNEKPQDLWEQVSLQMGPVVMRRGQIFPVTPDVLTAKVSLMEKHGVSVEQLVEWPDVLLFSLEELHARIDLLQRAGCSRVTTHLLRLCGRKSMSHLRAIVRKYFDCVQHHPSHMHYLAARLKCSTQEIYRLHRTYPRILTCRDISILSAKLDVLSEAGVDEKDILASPKVLEKGLATLRHRIQLLQDINAPIQTSYLVQGEPRFKLAVERFKTNRVRGRRARAAPSSPHKPIEQQGLERVAELVGLDANELERFVDLQPHKREVLLRAFSGRSAGVQDKLCVLEAAGANKWEIINHSHILHYSVHTLNNAIQQIDSKTPPIVLRIVGKIRGHLRHGRRINLLPILRATITTTPSIDKAKSEPNEESTVAERIECDSAEPQSADRESLADMYSADVITVKPSLGALSDAVKHLSSISGAQSTAGCVRNLQILLNAGYSQSTVVSACPLLLFCSTDTLCRELNLFTERARMLPYKHWPAPKRLNALQYFIERRRTPI